LWHNIQARAYNYLLLLTNWIQYGYMAPRAGAIPIDTVVHKFNVRSRPHARGNTRPFRPPQKRARHTSRPHARGAIHSNNAVTKLEAASPARARGNTPWCRYLHNVCPASPTRAGAILTTSLPWGNEVISTEGIHRLIMTCYQVEYGPVKRTTPRIGRKGHF